MGVLAAIANHFRQSTLEAANIYSLHGFPDYLNYYEASVEKIPSKSLGLLGIYSFHPLTHLIMATRVSNEHDQQSTKVEGVTTSCGKEGPPEHVDNISGDVVEKVHLDGTVDLVDKRAIGGDMEVMPPGYWKSFHFIGTVVVSNDPNKAYFVDLTD